MKTHHVCYEGTLACSGCNPCAHCLNVVLREVLAQAMRRTTEVIVQARGPEGTISVKELDTQNFWAVFYGLYGESWKTLHDNMMRDPKVAERAYDLRGIPGFEQTGRYVPPAPVPVLSPPWQAFAGGRFEDGSPSLPLPVTMVAPSPASPPPVVPLSSFAVPPSAVFAPLPRSDAGLSTMAFTLREEAPADGPVSLVEDVSRASEAKHVTGPADIRREITVDDIAASAKVHDDASASSVNGAVVHD